jgi:hypothetical protein
MRICYRVPVVGGYYNRMPESLTLKTNFMGSLDIEIENPATEGKEIYDSPKTEIIEIKVEKGFAASPTGSGDSTSNDWGAGTW